MLTRRRRKARWQGSTTARDRALVGGWWPIGTGGGLWSASTPGFRSWISREYLWARIRGVGPGDAQAEAETAGVGSSA